jgi:hypothetical protein
MFQVKIETMKSMNTRLLAHSGLLTLAVLAVPALAQFPKLPKVPKLPGGLPKMNSLDALLKGEPPLTTSLKDAGPDIPPLDLLVKADEATDLLKQPRTESGAYKLKRGTYFAELQSY